MNIVGASTSELMHVQAAETATVERNKCSSHICMVIISSIRGEKHSIIGDTWWNQGVAEWLILEAYCACT